MKNVIASLFVVGALCLASCDNKPKTEDTTTMDTMATDGAMSTDTSTMMGTDTTSMMGADTTMRMDSVR